MAKQPPSSRPSKPAAKPAAKPTTKSTTKPAAKSASKPASAPPAATAAKSAKPAPRKPVTKRIEAAQARPVVAEPQIPAPALKTHASAAPEGKTKVRASTKAVALELTKAAANKAAATKAAAITSLASPFSKAEIAEWRVRLTRARAQYSDDIQGLHQDAMEAEDGHTTPNHIAERGSDADMQDVALNIAGDEKNTLWLIDRALRKIDTGLPVAFGLCEHTKQPIGRSRLELMPWTPLSIEGAQYCEESNQMPDDILIDD